MMIISFNAFSADYEAYYNGYNQELGYYTKNPGTYSFRVNNIPANYTCRWYVDDSQVQVNTSGNVFSSTYNYTVSASDNNVEIKACIHNSSGDYLLYMAWHISGNNPPYGPWNEDPNHNETNVSINTNLAWTGGDPDGDDVTYKVYWGTDDTPDAGEYQGTTSSSSYNLGTQNYSTDYYWRIVVVDEYGLETNGNTWYYKTEDEPSYPPNASVLSPTSPVYLNIGQTKSFIVSATDANGDLDLVKWFKDGSLQTTNTGISGSSDTDNWSTSFSTSGTHYVTGQVWDQDENYDDANWTIYVNKPPNLPSSEWPVNNSSNIFTNNVQLSWTGGDPDGDDVTYYV